MRCARLEDATACDTFAPHAGAATPGYCRSNVQNLRIMAHHFLEVVSVTDAGRVRQYNEDSVAIDRNKGVMVLADGMGGHRAGEIASNMATEIILSSLRANVAKFGSRARDLSPMRAIDQSINRANTAVYEAAKTQSTYRGMGTTLVVALFHDNRVALGHIGDSRIYRLRG